jgi:hypothetical protein
MAVNLQRVLRLSLGAMMDLNLPSFLGTFAIVNSFFCFLLSIQLGRNTLPFDFLITS